ncbi:SURF1 family cytochrome oxidase biogenesis protein [Phytohabitans suffuscus]|uniref:SURF1-like protein n=1 Tax=Phytohabitans suffuscus TaxID=624315 RepID=A0A6F8YMP8_9ACTN|nr:SURF1 family protein [Phytohabitans suffuscus]BCB87316.1 SURF1-like protein [Phytohabitans suffuscus]
MYRFLLTPRWLGFAALIGVAAAVMVMLGNWQLHRYQERSATNERIDESSRGEPVPLPEEVPAAWTRVTVTGQYDPTNEILVRGRTVDGAVGYEIVTPLVRTDGPTVLVDRGWVPPAPAGAVAMPKVPAPPTGEVTVVGRVHKSESRPESVSRREGRIEVRRIGVERLAEELPYPLYGAYVLAEEPTEGFTAVTIQHENSWQNAGYVLQWWLFAALAVAGFGWMVYREAHPREEPVDRAEMAAA